MLVATHTKALHVYRGQQLAWAAQLELLPVAVRVTSIAGVRGMIVALDDTGEGWILVLFWCLLSVLAQGLCCSSCCV